MFEALVTLCALATGDAPAACRAVLLPGFASDSSTTCEAALRAAPPDWLAAYSWQPTCAPRPPPTLAFEQIAPGVFVHLGLIAEPDAANGGDVANISFIVGQSSIAVIDAGASRAIGEQVYLAIRAQSPLPVSHLILTHMHPDHVLGAEPLREAGAQVLGHATLAQALSDRRETYTTNFARLIGSQGFLASRIIGPDLGLVGPQTLDLGGRRLHLQPQATAHTATDLTVFDETSGILFSGDLVVDQMTPALDGSLRGWQAVLADLQASEARLVVPGHGGPLLPWPAGGDAMNRYLKVLETDSRAALDQGLGLAAATALIGQSEASHWRLFEQYNRRNATVAYTEMEWD
ncbi:quinoprotein relay system zinc metallohydrolase 2 [Rhodobacter ferrooxidans]|uniref:Beta-lactamase domain protein n=1 Tax=Rhodobacter ferrooxidans TaxID=371731 RepID=C8S586_9RHOB|nr:quinoprotein relay system zinc metallohydrolase 2 [Rhodobacter sp. SW2]EEW23882.1 beta-lactamase domain protein [Rhodobacter sp. SW2]